VVHHALLRVIRRFIKDSYACRKGKGTQCRALEFAQGFQRGEAVSAPSVQSVGVPQQKLPARPGASQGVLGVRQKRAAKEAAPRRGE